MLLYIHLLRKVQKECIVVFISYFTALVVQYNREVTFMRIKSNQLRRVSSVVLILLTNFITDGSGTHKMNVRLTDNGGVQIILHSTMLSVLYNLCVSL